MNHAYVNAETDLSVKGTKGWNKAFPPKGIAHKNESLFVSKKLNLPIPAEVVVLGDAYPRDLPPRRYSQTELSVMNIDTVSAGLHLGPDTVVLSFGNDRTPGGRYTHDGLAQEEDLCRLMPQLYPSLVSSNTYPIPTGTALLSRDLIVARKPLTYSLLPGFTSESEDVWPDSEGGRVSSTLSVITAAMPCGAADKGRPKGGWLGEGSAWASTVTKCVRSILYAGVVSGKSNLVLGAIGCGAYGNPTRPVASVFRSVLESQEFRGFFSKIIFAIIDPLGTGNIMPFREELAIITRLPKETKGKVAVVGDKKLSDYES